MIQTMTEKIHQRNRHDECERDLIIGLWIRNIICVDHACMAWQSNDIVYREINKKWEINYINLFFWNPVLFWALEIFCYFNDAADVDGQHDKYMRKQRQTNTTKVIKLFLILILSKKKCWGHNHWKKFGFLVNIVIR